MPENSLPAPETAREQGRRPAQKSSAAWHELLSHGRPLRAERGPAPEHARASANCQSAMGGSGKGRLALASANAQATAVGRGGVAHAPPHERINTSRSAFRARSGSAVPERHDWSSSVLSRRPPSPHGLLVIKAKAIERTRPGPRALGQVG